MLKQLADTLAEEYTPLSPAETRRLIRLTKQGGAEGRAANEVLLLRNVRLILQAARRYQFMQSATLTPDDLLQAAFIGFQNAIHKYRPSHGVKFGTYATTAMRRACKRALDNCAAGLRLPVHIERRRARIRKAQEQAPAQSPAEIGQRLGLSPAQVTDALHPPIVAFSLDEPTRFDPDTTLGEILSAASANDEAEVDEAERDLARAQLLEFFQRILSNRDYLILTLRYGLHPDYPAPLQFHEIGELVGGLTRQRIQQIVLRAEATLRLPLFAQRLRQILAPQ